MAGSGLALWATGCVANDRRRRRKILAEDNQSGATARIGISLSMWTRKVGVEHVALMEGFATAGFSGLEIPYFPDPPAAPGNESAGVAIESLLKQALEEANLAPASVWTSVTAEANPISEISAVRDRAVDRLVRTIEWADALGANVVTGPLHSPRGVFTGRARTPDETLRCIDVLRRVADATADRNIRIALSPTTRFDGYAFNTAGDLAEVVRSIDRPNVGVAWNTAVAHIEESDVEDAIFEARDVLFHVQAQENQGGVPGSGQVNWQGTFETLRDIGYSDWIIAQSFDAQVPGVAEAEHLWRAPVEDRQAAALDTAKFLSATWKKSR